MEQHTPLLLKVARGFGGGHDATLDRYTYMLERLRENEFRRLRAFRADGPARFSTWLVVPAPRHCLEHPRARFGRPAPADSNGHGLRELRRRLASSQGESIDLSTIPDPSATAPEDRLDISARDHALNQLIGRLPPRDRLLLQLRFQDDLSASAIARTLRMPTPFHVYRRIRSVIGQLRTAIKADPLLSMTQDQ